VKADQPTVTVHDRELINRVEAHQRQRLRGGRRGRNGLEVSLHSPARGSGEIEPSKQAATNIAIGEGADQAAFVINHQSDAGTAAVDGIDGIAQAGINADAAVSELRSHRVPPSVVDGVLASDA
jgi:hypothetical protein